MLFLRAIILLFFIGFSLGCAKDTSNTITITGSSTVLPVITQAAERYMTLHPDIRILVSPGGSGVGVRSVASGLVDIGMVSRKIAESELVLFKKEVPVTTVIGRDAVAAVVSDAIFNTVSQLSFKQLRGIYSGHIQNWSEVGGPNANILVVDKEAHRGTRQVFMVAVFGDSNPVTPGSDLVTGSNNEEHTKLSQSSAAIGMLSFAWVSNGVRAIGIVDDGQLYLPTVERIQDGSYPISRDLSLITAGTPMGIVRDFMAFVLSSDGQAIVAKSGYVPIR